MLGTIDDALRDAQDADYAIRTIKKIANKYLSINQLTPPNNYGLDKIYLESFEIKRKELFDIVLRHPQTEFSTNLITNTDRSMKHIFPQKRYEEYWLTPLREAKITIQLAPYVPAKLTAA